MTSARPDTAADGRPVAHAVLPAGHGTSSTGFPRTVTHFGGQTLLRRRPERFVAIATGQLDAALGLGVVPVAATRNNSGELVPAHVPPSVEHEGIVDLGLRTAPDLELLAGARPDLVAATYRGQGRTLYPRLSALAPTVLTEGKGFNWKRDLLLLATALGRERAADQLLGRYADAVDRLRGRLLGRTPTVSVLRFGPAGLETHGHWSFCGSILTDVGVARPAGQDAPDNGTVVPVAAGGERPAPDLDAVLPRLDADLVVLTRLPAGPGDLAWRAVANSAAWRSLPAVTGGRVHEVAASSWHGHAGPLAALAVLADLERLLR